MIADPVAPANANVMLSPQTVPTPDAVTSIVLSQNAPRLPQSLTFNTAGAKGIMLEPSVVLNQKARYLQHLNHLRRINEGDDTAESPGYALHLVRVPVSLLPGKCTQEGHGAEVTMTAALPERRTAADDVPQSRRQRFARSRAHDAVLE